MSESDITDSQTTTDKKDEGDPPVRTVTTITSEEYQRLRKHGYAGTVRALRFTDEEIRRWQELNPTWKAKHWRQTSAGLGIVNVGD